MHVDLTEASGSAQGKRESWEGHLHGKQSSNIFFCLDLLRNRASITLLDYWIDDFKCFVVLRSKQDSRGQELDDADRQWLLALGNKVPTRA